MTYYTRLSFDNDINTSCQVGDIAYCSTLGSSGGFDTGAETRPIGKIVKIFTWTSGGWEKYKTIIVDLGDDETLAQEKLPNSSEVNLSLIHI